MKRREFLWSTASLLCLHGCDNSKVQKKKTICARRRGKNRFADRKRNNQDRQHQNDDGKKHKSFKIDLENSKIPLLDSYEKNYTFNFSSSTFFVLTEKSSPSGTMYPMSFRKLL